MRTQCIRKPLSCTRMKMIASCNGYLTIMGQCHVPYKLFLSYLWFISQVSLNGFKQFQNVNNVEIGIKCCCKPTHKFNSYRRILLTL